MKTLYNFTFLLRNLKILQFQKYNEDTCCKRKLKGPRVKLIQSSYIQKGHTTYENQSERKKGRLGFHLGYMHK